MHVGMRPRNCGIVKSAARRNCAVAAGSVDIFTVLRQAMAGDTAEPAGLYFGTNTGSIFASADEGESWEEIARHLPTVLCVEVAAA